MFTGIQQLHGASWKGSHLRVERAKESFLDRLKRERAATKQEGEKSYYEKSENLTVNSQRLNVSDREGGLVHSKGHRPEQSNVLNDIRHSNKRKECNTNDEISQTDSYSLSSKKERKKKKNEVEEKILSSFKQFSSVWADSDNENDEEATGFEVSHDESHEELRSGKTADKPHKLTGNTSYRGTQNVRNYSVAPVYC